MADNITQARRVVGQFLAQNRGSVQTPGAVERLVADVDRLVRGTSALMGAMPYIQRLETVGDDDAAIGFARGLLKVLNRPSQRSAKAAAVIAAAKANGVKTQSPLLAPARALFNAINFLEVDAQAWRDAIADMNRLDDMIGGAQLSPGEKGIIAGALQNCDTSLRGGLAALKRGAGISRDRYKQTALSAVREIISELQ